MKNRIKKMINIVAIFAIAFSCITFSTSFVSYASDDDFQQFVSSNSISISGTMTATLSNTSVAYPDWRYNVKCQTDESAIFRIFTIYDTTKKSNGKLKMSGIDIYIFCSQPFYYQDTSQYYKNGSWYTATGPTNMSALSKLDGYDFYGARFSVLSDSDYTTDLTFESINPIEMSYDYSFYDVVSKLSSKGLLDMTQTNIDIGNDKFYNADLPGVKNLKFESLSMVDCHGKNDNFNMCFGLSWDKPDNALSGDYYVFKFLLKYNYNTYFSTKRSYGSAFIDSSPFFDSPVLISSYAADFCAHDFSDNLNIPLSNDLDYVSSFTIENVQKVFVQSYRVIDGETYHGDWYVYSVNKDNSLSPDYNKQDIGDGTVYPGDTNPNDQGEFPDDTPAKDEIPAPDKDDDNIFAGIDFSDVSGVLSNFFVLIKNLLGSLGAFPLMFSTVFSFLPYEISTSIVLLFYIAIIIGLLKIFS